jgi:hypothetical protein
MRVTAVWDNGGRTLDRYTVAVEPGPDWPQGRCVPMLAMSIEAGSPQGVSQWTLGVPGPQLGREILWEELPEQVRAHAAARLRSG